MIINNLTQIKYSQDIAKIIDLIQITSSTFAISCFEEKKVRIIRVDSSTFEISILNTIDCKDCQPWALYKISDNLLLVGYNNKLEVIEI